MAKKLVTCANPTCGYMFTPRGKEKYCCEDCKETVAWRRYMSKVHADGKKICWVCGQRYVPLFSTDMYCPDCVSDGWENP